MTIFLGIDIGTSGTKTIAIDEKGTILAQAMDTYSSFEPKPLWSEQNPDDWWRATVNTIRQVVKEAGIKGADVRAIGLSGQMHGSVFLDRNNKVIRPAILWNDQRTAVETAEMEEAVGGREELVKLVANPGLTGFTAPKILWLRKHEPENFERTCKVLLPKDEIRRRLTGEFATDLSDASGYLLLDVAQRRWNTSLLSTLDLSIDLLPRCVESSEVTGTLTAKAAELLGLSRDCVVVGGAGDCAAGAIGNGVVREGILSTIVGTASIVIMHSDKFALDPLGRLHTICHAVPGRWLLMGANLCGAGALQWFRNRLCSTDNSIQQAEDERIGHSGSFYDTLSAEAEKIPAGSEGLFFLPYLSGERTPHNDPLARACFLGLTLAHTRGHMVRSIMEGVAFNMRDSLDMMRDLGTSVREIRATGGGSHSQLWRSIQADVFASDVLTINCDEGPALGVALLAAVGANAFSSIDEACQATIRVTGKTDFERQRAEFYQRAFTLWKCYYPRLKESFQEIAALCEEKPLVLTHEPIGS
ncbi:MAG: xylulokinase [Cyanobacteria bacterium]|nr:xylulokinase [Cyanobacteriota bacterium]